YYGYRYYSPELGRWLSRDPMGRRIKPNLYAGLLNDPIRCVDADGRDESYWPPGNNAPPGGVISPDPNPPSPSPPSDGPSCPAKCLNFIKGVKAGLQVRGEFLKMIDQYECCVKGKIVGLDSFDGCKDGAQANWTVAHRITGCEMKAAGVDKDTMDNLNAIHETIEFCRGECGKFDDWGSYVDDTFKDMKAIQEGFGTDGKDCYNRFIPSECKKKAKK
ncbi:MAG: RHS repeat-associated core domain-containing protein, partial [Candidatus Eisenbacteria bacterium]|nr:RHS repeat-associated core domain-containing protein [Candidatus Eisenbacteria bacterium]